MVDIYTHRHKKNHQPTKFDKKSLFSEKLTRPTVRVRMRLSIRVNRNVRRRISTRVKRRARKGMRRRASRRTKRRMRGG